MDRCTRIGGLLLAALFFGSLSTAAFAADRHDAAATLTIAAAKTSKASSKDKKKVDTQASAKEKALASLEKAATQQVKKVSKTLRPDINHKTVKKNKEGKYVATYKVVDEKSLSYSVNDGASDGQFVGNVIYIVHEYQCVGKNKKEALKAPCEKVKSQRIREMSRYEKGAWHM